MDIPMYAPMSLVKSTFGDTQNTILHLPFSKSVICFGGHVTITACVGSHPLFHSFTVSHCLCYDASKRVSA